MDATNGGQLLLCLFHNADTLFQHIKICGDHGGENGGGAVTQMGLHSPDSAFIVTVSKICASTAVAVDIHKTGSYIVALGIDGLIPGTTSTHRKNFAILQVDIHILKFASIEDFSVGDTSYHF